MKVSRDGNAVTLIPESDADRQVLVGLATAIELIVCGFGADKDGKPLHLSIGPCPEEDL